MGDKYAILIFKAIFNSAKNGYSCSIETLNLERNCLGFKAGA